VTGRPTSPDDLATGEQPIVFMIDDDESMRRALANLFQSVGLRVELFGSAPDLLRSKLPDVASCLVLDIRLPGLSGFGLSTRARQGEHSHSDRFYDRRWRSLCENSTRYKRTPNFEACGRAQSKKAQKFVLRSALRPNQISFSHSLGDIPTSQWPRRLEWSIS
jgi:CheY-like chemotaxis protein